MNYQPDEKAGWVRVGQDFYQYRWRYCGKSNCARCPHGPYWFRLSERADGGWKSWYVGRKLPANVLRKIQRENAGRKSRK